MFNKREHKVGRETNLLLSKHVKITHDAKVIRLGCENVLVIGATGTGKSYMYLKPNLWSLPTLNGKPCSCVITDPKGELANDTAAFLQKHGYKIKILNLNEPKYSDSYNPFKYVKDDLDLSIVIDMMVKNTLGDGGKDPFWNDMAKAMISGIAFYLYYERPFEEQSFPKVAELLGQCGDRIGDKKNSTFERILDNLEKTSPLGKKHPAIMNFSKVRDSTGSTYSSILSSAQGVVRIFASADIIRLMSTDTLELDLIGDEPTAFYVITSTTNSTYDMIAAMVYTQMFETLLHRANTVYANQGHSLPHHILLFLDEFANIGQIPDFDKKIAVFRQANMSCSIIVQTPNQIASIYDKKADNIIGNTSIVLFLGNAGLGKDSAAEWMSTALGNKTIQVEQTSTNKADGKGAGLMFGSIISLSHSYSATQRPLMTPDEVRQLPGDECIVLIAGQYPFRDKKITPPDALNFDEASKLKYDIHENKKTLDSHQLGIKQGKEIDEIRKREREEKLKEDNAFNSINDKELEEVRKMRQDFLIMESMLSGCEDVGDYVKEEVVVEDIKSFSPTFEWDLPDGEKVEDVEMINTWTDTEDDDVTEKNIEDEFVEEEEDDFDDEL